MYTSDLYKDNYNNLSLKTKAMLNFSSKFCSENIKKYFFHDSDAYPHPKIEELIRSSINESTVEDEFLEAMKKLLWEKVWFDWVNRPVQFIEPELVCFRISGKNHTAVGWGKYNLTSTMYDHRYAIPDYCNGQATLFNRKAIELISKESLRTRLDQFRIEDIYFTGILRKKANITKIR